MMLFPAMAITAYANFIYLLKKDPVWMQHTSEFFADTACLENQK